MGACGRVGFVGFALVVCSGCGSSSGQSASRQSDHETGGTSGGGGAHSTGGRSATGGASSTGGSENAGGSAAACVDPDGIDASTRRTTSGPSGRFTDTCDGNYLIEYFCDLETGDVESDYFPCDGPCEGGACLDPCDDLDRVTYVEIDGDAVTFEDFRLSYGCRLLSEGDGFDCLALALVGESFAVSVPDECAGPTFELELHTAEAPDEAACAFECRFTSSTAAPP